MKNKNKCDNCGSEKYDDVLNIKLCTNCQTEIFEFLLKRNTPKAIRSIFLKDK